jgi:two-component system, cell cycle response regulator DivK
MAAPLILVVEDDRDDEAALVQALAAAGYEAQVTRDGLTTLRAARRARPDAVLLDLELPELNGFEVARRLRADAYTRQIPIVAVTAYQHRFARDVAVALGCQGYLTKPFDAAELQSTLGPLVGSRRIVTPAGRLDGVRVLIVDDQAESMEPVVYGLQREGAEVRIESSVYAGLAALLDFIPDAVLADIGFPGPGGGGYDLLSAVRALPPPLSATPVVAVTGYVLARDESRAREAGFDLFVAKPVTPDVVVAELVRLVR